MEEKRSGSRHSRPFTCDRFDYYDLCRLTHQTIMDPTAATLFAVASGYSAPPPLEKIRPYPRKYQDYVMILIKELSVTAAPSNDSCAVTHHTPALVFSAGGLTGNFFHDINDGLVPLFITVNSHFPDRDVILAVVDCADWWLHKYADLFPRFSRHPIINLDRETTPHCFPSAIVGLISHGAMTVDPTSLPGPHPKTISDFRSLLATAYGNGQSPKAGVGHQPQLVLLNRTGNRRIVNAEEVKRAARVVGFGVVVLEPTLETPLHQVFGLIDGSHGLIGVHGAGLTHVLFLRPGSVFMQVVPIGLNWLANHCYKKTAIELGLEYMEYEVGVDESSLAGQYTIDSLELQNPGAFVNGNWSQMSIYMTQDVKLDILRLESFLKTAYKKLKKLTPAKPQSSASAT